MEGQSAALRIAAVLAVTQALGSLLFSVSPRDPGSITGAALILAIVALAATLIPARRAMRVDRVEALRSE